VDVSYLFDCCVHGYIKTIYSYRISCAFVELIFRLVNKIYLDDLNKSSLKYFFLHRLGFLIRVRLIQVRISFARFFLLATTPTAASADNLSSGSSILTSWSFVCTYPFLVVVNEPATKIPFSKSKFASKISLVFFKIYR
jgi:hypothetical protein